MFVNISDHNSLADLPLVLIVEFCRTTGKFLAWLKLFKDDLFGPVLLPEYLLVFVFVSCLNFCPFFPCGF